MSDNMATIERALNIKNSLGVRVAAGYLRNQGWPLTLSVSLLARRQPHTC